MSKKEKMLLIEATDFVSKVKISGDLKEAVKLSAGKAGTLIVRNVPCTILNRLNQNGRIYTTEVVQAAIEAARPLIENKQLLSQACEHPEGSFVAPTVASHVIIGAYIKKNINIVVENKKIKADVLFMDWEVLNTTEGKNLRALLEAECSVGTSIRGVGDMNGKYVENYELIGVDIVGNPSSSTFTRMPVSESIKVELVDPRELNETFTVTTSSTNVVRDLEAAAQIQERLDSIGYGTVTKTSTKVDEETDPKTGAQTSITTLEAETSDDVADLDSALGMAKNAMLNGVVNVDSITIENIKEEQPKEAVIEEEYAPLEKEITEAVDDKNNEPEDKLKGKKFVLKTPSGFVGIEGNGLIFLDEPKYALHFVQGKEEGGMVPLSNIEKKLDSIGMFDVEKHYKKDTTDIGVQEPTDISKVEPAPKEEGLLGGDINISTGDIGVGGASGIGTTGVDAQENSIDGMPTFGVSGQQGENKVLGEDNGSNTKYTATVEMEGPGRAPEISTVPVSAVELDAVLAEVGNLWEMKYKNNNGTMVYVNVQDTTTGEEYAYNPNENTLEPVANNAGVAPIKQPEMVSQEIPTQEAFGKEPITQNDNKVNVDLGNDVNIEKEFDTPVQAQVAKAGVEQGKVDPSILVTEERPMYQDIQPGWYAGSKDIGVTGPYNSEEEAWSGLEDYKDFVSVHYIDAEGNESNPSMIAAEAAEEYYLRFFDGGYMEPKVWGEVKEGPFSSKEEAEARLNEIVEDYIRTSGDQDLNMSPADVLGVYPETMEEKVFKNPSEPSDQYVNEPLTDAAEDKIVFTLGNIDWDVDDVITKFNHMSQADDVANGGDLESMINDLPETLDVVVNRSALPEDRDDIAGIQNVVFSTAYEQFPLRIKDAECIALNNVM